MSRVTNVLGTATRGRTEGFHYIALGRKSPGSDGGAAEVRHSWGWGTGAANRRGEVGIPRRSNPACSTIL